MPGCKPRVRVFRNMNGNPAGIPALPSDIGIRYGYQVPGTLALGTRYRINAEGRTPKAEPGHWTPVGEGRYDSAWDPGTTWTGSRDSCTTPCVAACPESPGRSTTSASGGKGKRYKLVTFSLLYPARHRRFAEGLQVEGPILGWVSSWRPSPWASWRLGPQTVFVERVEVEPPPPWADTMTWRTLSPVCVSTGRMPEGLCRPGRPRQGSGLGLDGSRPGGPAGTVHGVRVRGWRGVLRVSYRPPSADGPFVISGIRSAWPSSPAGIIIQVRITIWNRAGHLRP